MVVVRLAALRCISCSNGCESIFFYVRPSLVPFTTASAVHARMLGLPSSRLKLNAFPLPYLC